MLAYIYKAAMLCEACALMRCHDIRDGIVPGDLDSADSDDAPQGPFANGGGEADSPQHCDHCGVFLENPLTQDGRDYVEMLRDNYRSNARGAGHLATWIKFYDLEYTS